MRARLLSGLAAAALLAGCPTPDPNQGLGTTAPDQLLDFNQFVCGAMPVLIRRCSYLACHGNPNHAFRIYSAGKLRQTSDGTRNTRDSSLGADELELNFESASGMVLAATPAERAAADVTKVPLLGKPLARRAGGAEHHGVAIFPVYPIEQIQNDPEWQQLVLWVGGAKQPNPVDADCAGVFSNIGIDPRKP